MKHTLLTLLLLLSGFWSVAQQQNGTFSTNPPTFGENEEITVTVSGIDPAAWGVTDVYLWAWYFDSEGTITDSPTNGTWTNSNETQKMTANGDGTFSFTFTPSELYQATGIVRIGMLAKAKDGTGDKKTQDYLRDVGGYQLVLTNPTQATTLVDGGSSFTITATASEASSFSLTRNGAEIHTASATTSYSHTVTVNETGNFELSATANGETLSESFTLAVRPTVTEAPVPAGLKDGLNLDPLDATRATFVLYAPDKESVHLIGSFNDWQINDAYLLNKDSTQDRFWIELTGLTPQTPILYQYLVDLSINIADPYSTLLLDEFNDPFIDNITYPDMPAYPSGLTTEMVSVFETGTPEYAWSAATTSFVPPAKEDLVIYELHIRDFDALHSFDAVRNRLDYLETLGVNAIELMPVNEFDGNDSWGYNPAFHMALDKYYGTKDAFKAFIDECHNRGMAVIIDVVYNHATGQHPYVRLWNATNGTPSGAPTADNPFFNTEARHAYNVFNDFNHQSQATRDYVKQTAAYWIEEYKLDGFRWDLTKGFTQNCTGSDNGCTDGYQQDRVDVLKEYADLQWATDPDFLVIFEHLGGIQEEEQWSNYRVDEGKGILLWNKQTFAYNEATMGFHQSGSSNISGASWKQKGFDLPAAISYMESHDEERLMFKNLEFGNETTGYSVKNLATALYRMQAAGAFFFTIPGPKMIWQFGELGYDVSIDFNGRTGAKPIRWEYFDNADRKAIYDNWSDLIALKKGEPIFGTSEFTIDAASTSGLKTIHLTDPSAAEGEIQYVTVIGNFGITTQEINPNFQQEGIWYEVLNGNLKKVVVNPTATISLAPGEFRIYADQPSALFPDLNIPDEDNDGVADADDLCPGTPLGSTVNTDGCEIFALPASNYRLAATSERCADNNDGSIAIEVETILNYNYVLSSNGSTVAEGSFSGETHSLTDLSAGTYDLCFTLAEEPDYEQCFTLVITEPEPLDVQAKANESNRTLDLDLSGASSYTITVNGVSWQTENASYSVELTEGWNTVEVRTALECQGVFSQRFYMGEAPSAYPNPAREQVWVQVPGSNGEMTYALYTLQGQFIKSGKLNASAAQTTAIPVRDLNRGIYLLEVISAQGRSTFKISKQ